MHHNGTSDRQGKYFGIQISGSGGTLTAAILNLVREDVENELTAIKNVFKEISLSCKDEKEIESKYQKMYLTVRNTMTDRTAVIYSLCNLLDSLRKEFLYSHYIP